MVYTEVAGIKLSQPLIIDCACPTLGRLCDECFRENISAIYRKQFTMQEALEIRNDPERCKY
jgi:hypothetical protein